MVEILGLSVVSRLASFVGHMTIVVALLLALFKISTTLVVCLLVLAFAIVSAIALWLIEGIVDWNADVRHLILFASEWYSKFSEFC